MSNKVLDCEYHGYQPVKAYLNFDSADMLSFITPLAAESLIAEKCKCNCMDIQVVGSAVAGYHF